MILYKVAISTPLKPGEYFSAGLIRSLLRVCYKVGEEVSAEVGYLFCFKELDAAKEWRRTHMPGYRLHGTYGTSLVILKCESITPSRPLKYCLALFYANSDMAIREFWNSNYTTRRRLLLRSKTPNRTYGVKKLRVLGVVE